MQRSFGIAGRSLIDWISGDEERQAFNPSLGQTEAYTEQQQHDVV